MLENVEGLPADLKGTFFQNGPGRFSVEGQRVRHQLDGDGFVLAVTVSNGQLLVRQRLTQTQGLLRDNFEKRIVSRGRYGTEAQGGLPWDRRKFEVKNTANAGILWYQEKLMVLSPAGKPYLLDPANLGTILGNQQSAASDLGGALDEGANFGATPRVCATTGKLVNFDADDGTEVRFYEFNDDWKRRFRLPRKVNLSRTLLSDFAVTPNWYVVASPPLSVDGFGAASGKLAMEVLSYDPSGTSEFTFAPRSPEGAEVTLSADGLVCQEFANAYELEVGRLVLDIVAADRWDLGRPPTDSDSPLWEVQDPAAMPRTQLVRYEVDLNAQSFKKTVLCERHIGFASVNPSVSGKKHRYIFCAVGHSDSGVGPMAGFAKIDTDSGSMDAWVPGAMEFGAQPVFVPRENASDEDDGYLVGVIFDGAAQRSDFVVLDAKNISQGPVCRVPLEKPVPLGQRTTWADGLTYTNDELKRKHVLLRMFQKKAKEWNELDTSFSIFDSNIFFVRQGTKIR